MHYRVELERLLNRLPHKLIVEFAVYCVNDVKELIPKKALPALELTEKWLKNPLSVSNKELSDATNAAYATNATYAAANAAHAAANAAHAAARAAKSSEKKQEQYYTHLFNMITNLSELEKVIYNINIIK